MNQSITAPSKFSTDYFQDLYPGVRIIIPATSGKRILKNAYDVFPYHIDSHLNHQVFRRSDNNPETPETEVKVLKVKCNLTLKTMFTSISPDIKRMGLTQHQIRAFCEAHPDMVFKLKNHVRMSLFLLFSPYAWQEKHVVMVRDCFGPIETLGERSLDLVDFDYDRVLDPKAYGAIHGEQLIVPVSVFE